MTARFLITAGPTREFIDPVRYLSNRSSGRMGYALAVAAARISSEVVLVTGPTCLPLPERVMAIPVVSAEEMAAAVGQHSDQADIMIMTAAVCDFRPIRLLDQKIKKSSFDHRLQLEPTPDILAALGKQKRADQVLVGFALETDQLVENARRKLAEKGADLVVANPAGAMDADTNEVTIVDKAGGVEEWPALPKAEVAERLVRRILQLLP